MDYEAILTHYGWSFFGDCQCGGSHFRKYDNPNLAGYEVWVGPDLQAFRIFDAAKEPMAEDRHLSRLEATLSLNKLY